MAQKITNAKQTTLYGMAIKFRNFAGRPTKFDKVGGKRSFALILTPELADALVADGWNVNIPIPKEEGYPAIPILNVKVNLTSYTPPEIWIVRDDTKTRLNEDSIGSLDYAEVENVDITFSPHEFQRKDGTYAANAYLSKLFVKIKKDELEEKYANLIDTSEEAVPFS